MADKQEHHQDVVDSSDFFSENTAPSDLERVSEELKSFIAFSMEHKRRVACVTSGGTIVPLEKNMVRFLDNFSAGNRGAASVEWFLSSHQSTSTSSTPSTTTNDDEYAVILLRRKGSAAPYARQIQEMMGCQHLDLDFVDHISVSDNGTLTLTDSKNNAVSDALTRAALGIKTYQKVKQEGRLMQIEFQTIVQYLFYLRQVSLALDPMGPRALIYFAAAVSDFFIPEKQQVTHKIQSSDGNLHIDMPNTPKLLSKVKGEWCQHSFCVSFKLETDRKILLSKAEGAITKYGMDCVVANILQTRRDEVILVNKDLSTRVLNRTALGLGPTQDLEEPLVGAIVDLHSAFINSQPASQS